MMAWITRLRRLLPGNRQLISISKGVLAYSLAISLAFVRTYDDTIAFPVVLTSSVIVTIAAKPGGTVGACLDASLFGALGVGAGAVFFIILAKLGDSQVAQGFVFFILVYTLSLIKAQSLRYFAFSLLATLVAFSGIYTSILLGTGFSPQYLESYLVSYAYGLAIVLGVNILVFPISAEREMREILVNSLDRVASFSHLIAKTYTLQISPEERVVRDSLSSSIKADVAFLVSKVAETSLEMNWSRFSLNDYRVTVQRLRQIQQGLMTSYTSLTMIEQRDPASLKLIERQLADTNTGEAFNTLRRSLDLAIRDIIKELNIRKRPVAAAPIFGSLSWEDFREKQDFPGDLESLSRTESKTFVDPAVLDAQLARVCSRLQEEVANSGPDHPTDKISPSSTPKRLSPAERIGLLRSSWEKFKLRQGDGIARLIQDGFSGSDELFIHAAGPSLEQQWMPKVGSARSTALPSALTEPEKRAPHSDGSASPPKGASEDDLERETRPAAESILRVYSFIFGMGRVISEAAALHEHLVPNDGERPRKRLHFHFFERVGSRVDKKDPMTLHEALSEVSGVPYVKSKMTAPLWTTYGKLEAMFRSDTSLFSFKVALAVTVYTVFLLAPSLSSFFVTYGLTGGVITIIVAVALSPSLSFLICSLLLIHPQCFQVSPTIGQGVFTFLLQILGTGFGSLYGMVILYIARGAQPDYVYSPYIIVCLLLPLAIFGAFLIYTRPQFFVGGLLLMNSAGILVITEWVYNEVQIRPGFDNPAYRAAKSLTATSIALVIATAFQLLILRTPARRTLRVQLSQVTFSLASYHVLFSSLMEQVVPIIPSDDTPPSQDAVLRVKTFLKARESSIQEELIALTPLLKFAAVEPSFGKKFDARLFSRIIRTHQLLLDRLVEARTAIGDEGFSSDVKRLFISKLGAYRYLNTRHTRAKFYICATSLSTKKPIPAELPSLMMTTAGIQHDALILAHRILKTPDGRELLHSDSFVRYFYFLISLTSLGALLSSLEEDLHTLFGDIDSDPFLFA